MSFLSSFFNLGLCALDVMMDDLKLLALLRNYPLGIVNSIFHFSAIHEWTNDSRTCIVLNVQLLNLSCLISE